MRISDWSSDVCSSDLQPGVEHERAAHRHHLPLAARHLAGALTAPLLEPREKRVYPLLARFDLAPAEHAGPHPEVLLDREQGEDVGDLGHVAHAESHHLTGLQPGHALVAANHRA